MLTMIRFATVTLAIAGGTVNAAAPAFAGADDGGNRAFWAEQAGATNPAPRSQGTGVSRRAQEYRAYSEPTARNATAKPKIERDPPNFYHAMGSMSVPQ